MGNDHIQVILQPLQPPLKLSELLDHLLGCFEPFLALPGDRPFCCLVVCLAFMANFSFLITVSQLPPGFRLHLELGNMDTSLPVARWLRRNEKVKSHSCCLLLNSCSCCVLNSWFSKHQDCSLVGQCLPSSSSPGCLAGQVKLNWAAWGEVGKVWGTGGGNSGPVSEHRRGAGTGHWCLGKC